jgi:hypothetical protein
VIDKHLLHLEGHRNDLKKDPTYARFAYVTPDDLELLSRTRLNKA